LAKEAVLSLDPSLPVFALAMLDERLVSQLALVRLIAVLSSAYAGAALCLAAFGLVAVLAHDVSQRGHEMGVRMALGAQRLDVLQLMLREGIALTAVGLLVGMALGSAVSNTIQDFLFGVSPSDPAIYAEVAAC
jgi:putative ABC transport system permease protein